MFGTLNMKHWYTVEDNDVTAVLAALFIIAIVGLPTAAIVALMSWFCSL